jgi:hypothetical protein
LVAAKHCIGRPESQAGHPQHCVWVTHGACRYGYALDGWHETRKLSEVNSHGKYLCAALALLPMAGALVGVAVDEWRHLGFSNWLSACRSAALSPASLVVFTFELLPSAIVGFLLAALAVQITGMLMRRVECVAEATLAAHSGCLFGMAAGLLLCTLVPPLPWMLAAEALLAALAAAFLFGRLQKPVPRAASVNPPTRAPTSA